MLFSRIGDVLVSSGQNTPCSMRKLAPPNSQVYGYSTSSCRFISAAAGAGSNNLIPRSPFGSDWSARLCIPHPRLKAVGNPLSHLCAHHIENALSRPGGVRSGDQPSVLRRELKQHHADLRLVGAEGGAR